MAFFTVPFTSLYLVPHSSGGAIAHLGGSYLANTFVSADIVEAFGVASTVLGQVGGHATALLSSSAAVVNNPLVVGSVVIAAVAVGTYCYFHGIPAPIEAALSKAGLGVASKQGFMISLPKLAVALVLLGGAGFLAFRFYKSIRAARRFSSDHEQTLNPERAEAQVDETIGVSAWTQFGSAVWSNGREAVNKAAEHASRLAAAIQETGVASLGSVRQGASVAGERAGTLASRLTSWIFRRPRRA